MQPHAWLGLAALGLLCLAPACDEATSRPDGGADGGYPDPAFVYEASGQLQTVADESFLEEQPTLYRTTDRLADLDVRCLAALGDEVLAGTASGLVRFDPQQDRFRPVALTGPAGAVLDLARARLSDGRLAVALADRLELVDEAGAGSLAVAAPRPGRAVTTDGSRVWLGTDQGLYALAGEALEPVSGVPAVEIRDLAFDGANLWLATADGLLSWDGSSVAEHRAASGELPDDDVRAVVVLEGGGVLAGCASGAARVGSAADGLLAAGPGALPEADITALAAGDGWAAFGHGIGASFIQGDFAHRDHYHSLRWLPAERVTAVALQADGTRWIATPAGISRIALVPTTLAEKAARFEARVERHWRLDFVSDTSSLADPWAPDEPLTHWDHDNDGLWTQMQIVAWSYAGAASGDPAFCQRARRAMRAMMWEIDIPAQSFAAAGRPTGFVTRSLVRDDEGSLFESKAEQPNWHLVAGWQDGHDYYWKDDTSSDETTGHFFGYPVYFDLCADEAERQELAAHAGALARRIVADGFLLLDLDGEPTSFGHWNPERLAIALDGLDVCMEQYDLEPCIEARYGGGWLNAIEILGHLLAAWHMTGDPFFYDAYLELVDDQRYAELVDFNDEVFTVTKRGTANHSDHELAMLAYHTLIRYEPDDERRARWIRSLLDMYEWEVAERNPLWSAIIAGFAPDGYHLAEAVQTLREWPEDWREWLVDNSHRADVVRDVADRHGNAQVKTVLPYDEIRTMKWNSNPYALVDGGDGRSVQAPWPWLLPYWIYRYHGIIE